MVAASLRQVKTKSCISILHPEICFANLISMTAHYLHGTSPTEQDRLGLMNRLLNQNSLREMELRRGDKVLDLGSGLGQLSREMARHVGPTGQVIGIERSREQIAAAVKLAEADGEENVVEFRKGQAHEIPLRDQEWGTFDVAHARFLLEHVPNPVTVVRQMIKTVRPGGRIILEDDPHDTLRLWPDPPGFSRLWATYQRTYDRVGNDPLIGHRLVAILVEAGAEPVRNAWPFFGACAGQPEQLIGHAENVIRILEGVRDPILGLGEFDTDSFDACLEAVRRWARRPDAAFWYAVSYAEGRRK
jgi:SAM-dependent methyltransferase